VFDRITPFYEQPPKVRPGGRHGPGAVGKGLLRSLAILRTALARVTGTAVRRHAR